MRCACIMTNHGQGVRAEEHESILATFEYDTLSFVGSFLTTRRLASLFFLKFFSELIIWLPCTWPCTCTIEINDFQFNSLFDVILSTGLAITFLKTVF